MRLDDEALPRVLDFARGFASRHKWDDAAADRLAAASEETLAILMQYGVEDGSAPKRLSVSTRLEDGAAELEFTSALEGDNVEDRLAYLSELPQVPDESEISYRLLRYYADSISHQKYYGVDVISLRVDGPDPAGGAVPLTQPTDRPRADVVRGESSVRGGRTHGTETARG